VTDCEDGIKARDELLKVDNNFDVLLIDVFMPEMYKFFLWEGTGWSCLN
jgi:hypothetical protein